MQNALDNVKSKRTAFAVHFAPMANRRGAKRELRPEPAIRLERARKKRGFLDVAAAARAFGWNETTYAQHERGERGLSRSVTQYASAFRVSVGWLMNGEGQDPFNSSVPLVGFTVSDSNTVIFNDGSFDDVEAPKSATEHTVAVEIRGDSLGPVFDGWIAFYNDHRERPDPKIIGSLCIVGLADDRVMIKRIEHGQLQNRFTLKSNTQPPVYDAEIEWAAPLLDMRPKAQRIIHRMLRLETKNKEVSDA